MKLRQNGTVSFSIRLAAFQASGGARVKLQRNGFDFIFFRQELQDYQDFFGLVWLYPVNPLEY